MFVRRSSSLTTLAPLALALAGVLGAGGCSRGVGATCQYNEDCDGELLCCNGGLPRDTSRGSCQLSCESIVADDAAVPRDAYAIDGPMSVDDDAAAPADDAAIVDDAASEPDAFSADEDGGGSEPDAAGADGGS